MSAPAGAVPQDSPDAGAYTTNGPVRAIAHAFGRTYIGGEFTRVGQRSGPGVVLSSAGAPATFPEVAGGEVHAAISDGNGGWFIGGSFTSVGNETRLGIAHVKADGSVDSNFEAAVTTLQGSPAAVYALLLSPPHANGERTLYVGGEFAQIGAGEPEIHSNIAALKASTGEPVSAFGPATDCVATQKPGCSPAVRSLALAHIELPVDGVDRPQPVLFVGGSFTLLGPSDAPVAVDGVGAVWGVGSVDSVSVPNEGAVLAAGATPWAPNLSNAPSVSGAAVYTLAVGPVKYVPGGTPAAVLPVYLGGWNIQALGDPVRPIARAHQLKFAGTAAKSSRTPDTTAAPFANWRPQPAGCLDCAVRAMALTDSTLYFGGDFTEVGTAPTAAGHVAKISTVPDPNVTTANQTATPLGAGVDAPVRSLALSATTLLAAGDFEEGILPLDQTSGTPSPTWTPPVPDMPVHAVASDASTTSIYAGGAFSSLGSVPRAGLAAFDSSGALLDWAPDIASDTDDRPLVHALAASGSTVYVGGRFDEVGGQAHNNLAAVHAASGNPLGAFDPGPSRTSGEADVLSLSLLGSRLYVGGRFDHIGGAGRKNLAALDAVTGAVAQDWDPAVTGQDAVVHTVLPACGAVFLGGRFDKVGGLTRENLAAVDPGTAAPTPWNPGSDGAVLALARFGPTIYAGGSFARVGGAFKRKVAGLTVATGAPTAFDAGIDAHVVGASVRALAVSDTAVYLGGRFENIREKSRTNLASVDPATGQPTSWDPAPASRVDIVAIGDGAVYAGGEFVSVGTTGQRGFASFGSGAGSPFAPAACASISASTSGFSPTGAGMDGGSSPMPTGPAARNSSSLQGPSPAAGRLAVRPTRVRFGGRALSVRFRLSRPGKVQLRFERRVARRCRVRSSARRRCMRYVRFADVRANGKRGLNRLSFPRQIVARRRLTPGRYRIKLRVLPLGRSSVRRQRVAHFTVLPR